MDRQIQRLAIVNRGEPAVRVLTAVAELIRRAGGHRSAPSCSTPIRTPTPGTYERPTTRCRSGRDVRRPGRRHAPIPLSR